MTLSSHKRLPVDALKIDGAFVEVQGYYFGRPMPAEEFASVLTSGRPIPPPP